MKHSTNSAERIGRKSLAGSPTDRRRHANFGRLASALDFKHLARAGKMGTLQ